MKDDSVFDPTKEYGQLFETNLLAEDNWLEIGLICAKEYVPSGYEIMVGYIPGKNYSAPLPFYKYGYNQPAVIFWRYPANAALVVPDAATIETANSL